MTAEDEPYNPHNDLTAEFAQKIIRAVRMSGGDASDLMVVLESILVGCMVANVTVFNLKPQLSADLVASSVDTAIERFTAGMNKHGKP
jgi:hypothetical protein